MADLREIAWDGRGRWCGDGAQLRGGRPALDVKHQCGNPRSRVRFLRYREHDCGIFRCAWCRRIVPWCFGSAGMDLLDGQLCDDCWCERHPNIEAEIARESREMEMAHG